MNNIQNHNNSANFLPLGDWEAFLSKQLSAWQTARDNYEALKKVKIKTLNVNGREFKVQFNPARIVSSGAKVDAKTIKERKCFLCAENRPKEQLGIFFNPNNSEKSSLITSLQTQGGFYTILVNPFPIFPKHFTIPDNQHLPQIILSRIGDMLELAKVMNNYVVFYNGPKCGASAPDHAHFQAGNKGFLPVEKYWRNYITEKINKNLFTINYGFPAFAIETSDKKNAIDLFDKIYNYLPLKEGEIEPMMNLLAWYEDGKYILVVIPRAKHRPDCYFEAGENKLLISPAAVDLGGVLITPIEKDFEKISSRDVETILGEVCLGKDDFSKIVKSIKKTPPLEGN